MNSKIALPRLLALISLVVLGLIILACGGGGGGVQPGATAVGRVLSVETGGPPNPQASVQALGSSTLTSSSDGSFQLNVPEGTTSLTVDPRTGVGVWIFATQPISGTTDVGDLWIGPERISLRGRVLNSTNSQPVANATVSFGGRRGVSGADGRFSLNEVAYSSATQTAFWGIVGSVTANGFFRVEFTTAPHTASGGIVNIGDLLVTPTSDPVPPGQPFNIWGRILPSAQAPGTIVTLKQNGNAVRIFNVGSDGSYLFWVLPGTYTISFAKGSLTAPDQTVTLTQPNEVIRRDATLN
jgi:hypothetical protein